MTGHKVAGTLFTGEFMVIYEGEVSLKSG